VNATLLAAASEGYQPDTATAEGVLADGAVFWTIEGEWSVFYEIIAGVATLIEGASYPNVDFVRSSFDSIESADGDAIGEITAKDAAGLEYSLMTFFQNGDISSVGISRLILDSLGGMEYSRVESADWAGIIFTQEDAFGDAYVVAGLKNTGDWFPSAGVGGGEIINHVPFHGQSNAMADHSKPIISNTPTGWGNLKFNRGVATWSSVYNPTTPEIRSDSGFYLVGLTADTVETRANALADHLKAALIGASKYAGGDTAEGVAVLMTSASLGGRKLAELGPEDAAENGDPGARPPGGFWDTLLDDISRAKFAVEAQGKTYALPFWNYDQGESEGDLKLYIEGPVLAPSALVSGYAAKALTMVQDFDTAARTITGKTKPTPCLITPACYNLLTPSAWLDVCDQSDLAIMIGPRYQMPTALMSTPRGDNIHYSPDGQRWIGEMAAKVGARVMAGENWQPLRALYAEKSGTNTVDVALHVPRPPLVIDTRSTPKVRGWGFRIYSGTIDSKADLAYPTAVEILPGGASVRLTFADSVPASAKLSIGGESIMPDLAGLAVTAVGATTLNGASAHTLTIVGDYTTMFNRAMNIGAFRAYGNRPSQSTIRAVALVGGDTVLTGEDSELRAGGSYAPFQVGDTVDAGLLLSRANLRDSDNAASINSFTTGPNTDQPYPLQNWLCQYDGLQIEGS
jgi:hypothetical protein